MDRKEYTDALRNIATFLDENPKVGLPEPIFKIYDMNTKAEAAIFMKTVGDCQKVYSDSFLYLNKQFGPITLSAAFFRNAVCVMKVVGTKRVEAQFYPAHDEDIVEWECNPILG